MRWFVRVCLCCSGVVGRGTGGIRVEDLGEIKCRVGSGSRRFCGIGEGAVGVESPIEWGLMGNKQRPLGKPSPIELLN